jgi:hypothetical protein
MDLKKSKQVEYGATQWKIYSWIYSTNGNDSSITKIKQAAGDKLGSLLC